MKKRNRWFVLEDNSEMLSELKELGEEIGSEPITARSIEAAEKLASSRSEEICLAFIDMMVPKTDADLDQLDTLMEERAQLASEDQGGVTRRLREIDAQIRPLIDLHGGFNFLKGDAQKAMKSWKIYLFSSRTPTTIEESRKDLAQLQIVDWLSKPVDDDLLCELIREHIK